MKRLALLVGPLLLSLVAASGASPSTTPAAGDGPAIVTKSLPSTPRDDTLIPDSSTAKRAAAVQSLIDAPVGTAVSEDEWVQTVGLPDAPKVPSFRMQKRRNAHRLSITVPRLHASLPVVPVGTKRGVVQIRGGIRQGSWDRSTKAIGSRRGVSVVYLHRDLGAGKRGIRSPLWGLPTVKRGAVIRAVDAHGHRHLYRVVNQRNTPKDDLPLDLLRKGGKPTLAAVTCGVRLVRGSDGAYHWTGRSVTYAIMIR